MNKHLRLSNRRDQEPCVTKSWHRRMIRSFLLACTVVLLLVIPAINILRAMQWQVKNSRTMEERVSFERTTLPALLRNISLSVSQSEKLPIMEMPQSQVRRVEGGLLMAQRSTEDRRHESRLSRQEKGDRFGSHSNIFLLDMNDFTDGPANRISWDPSKITDTVNKGRRVAPMGQPNTTLPEYINFRKNRWDYDDTEKRHSHVTNSSGVCRPMASWQLGNFPTCNLVHEVSLADPNTPNKYLGKGVLRLAWMIPDHLPDKNDLTAASSFVFRTQHMNSRLGEKNAETPILLEQNRVDSIALERLTSSPHVINEYAFCGQALVTEAGVDTLKGTYYSKDRNEINNTQRLSFAAQVAHTLMEVHSIPADNISENAPEFDRPTLAHGDFHGNNLLVTSDGRLVLNDFNQGILLHERINSNGTRYSCRHVNRRVNGLMYFQRPPERFDSKGYFEPDKIDIFGMGSILIELLTGKGRGLKAFNPSRKELRRPRIVHVERELYESKETAVVAMLSAARACLSVHPDNRPSARRVAKGLTTVMDWIKEGRTAVDAETAIRSEVELDRRVLSQEDIASLFIDDSTMLADMMILSRHERGPDRQPGEHDFSAVNMTFDDDDDDDDDAVSPTVV